MRIIVLLLINLLWDFLWTDEYVELSFAKVLFDQTLSL